MLVKADANDAPVAILAYSPPSLTSGQDWCNVHITWLSMGLVHLNDTCTDYMSSGAFVLASKKVVQTELAEKEYDLLVSVAKHEGLTIKEAARKALVEWSLGGFDLKQDSFFQLRPVRFREKIRNSEIDRFLYHAK